MSQIFNYLSSLLWFFTQYLRLSYLLCSMSLWRFICVFFERHKGPVGHPDRWHQRECQCGPNQTEMWVKPSWSEILTSSSSLTWNCPCSHGAKSGHSWCCQHSLSGLQDPENAGPNLSTWSPGRQRWKSFLEAPVGVIFSTIYLSYCSLFFAHAFTFSL